MIHRFCDTYTDRITHTILSLTDWYWQIFSETVVLSYTVHTVLNDLSLKEDSNSWIFVNLELKHRALTVASYQLPKMKASKCIIVYVYINFIVNKFQPEIYCHLSCVFSASFMQLPLTLSMSESVGALSQVNCWGHIRAYTEYEICTLSLTAFVC